VAVASTCLIALYGCANIVGEKPDYRGKPTNRTPFDSKYERVRKLLGRTSSFDYHREPRGRDHWQLPEETEKRGGGDCEDMAIWLYVNMIEAGIENARLCIGMRSPTDRDLHCWVMWYHEQNTYMLDPTTRYGIVQTTAVPWGFYRPSYSYQDDRRFVHSRTLKDRRGFRRRFPFQRWDPSANAASR